MPRTTVSIEIDSSLATLLRDYGAFLEEMKSLAAAAPDGAVLSTCERAVVEGGREHQRRLLEQAVQARVDGAEKKGRRCDAAPAASVGKTAARRRERS